MGKIVSGFSNIGKSSLSNYKDIHYIDFDTCYFKKIDNWVNIYIDCLLALQDKYEYVFITTYGDILEELEKRNIEYTLVFPERELKEEYRQRAIDRNSDSDFVEGFFSRWDTHIDDCLKRKTKNKIVLKSGMFLSDIINLI